MRFTFVFIYLRFVFILCFPTEMTLFFLYWHSILILFSVLVLFKVTKSLHPPMVYFIDLTGFEMKWWNCLALFTCFWPKIYFPLKHIEKNIYAIKKKRTRTVGSKCNLQEYLMVYLQLYNVKKHPELFFTHINTPSLNK